MTRRAFRRVRLTVRRSLAVVRCRAIRVCSRPYWRRQGARPNPGGGSRRSGRGRPAAAVAAVMPARPRGGSSSRELGLGSVVGQLLGGASVAAERQSTTGQLSRRRGRSAAQRSDVRGPAPEQRRTGQLQQRRPAAPAAQRAASASGGTLGRPAPCGAGLQPSARRAPVIGTAWAHRPSADSRRNGGGYYYDPYYRYSYYYNRYPYGYYYAGYGFGLGYFYDPFLGLLLALRLRRLPYGYGGG